MPRFGFVLSRALFRRSKSNRIGITVISCITHPEVGKPPARVVLCEGEIRRPASRARRYSLSVQRLSCRHLNRRHWHTFDVADEKANEEAFSRPGASRGTSAYPQIRFVSLVENGTHVLFGIQMDSYRTGEITLAKAVLPRLGKGMLCLADRNFFGFELWQLARGTGADLLWRMKKNMRMAGEKLLADGSYLSHVYPSERDWRHKTNWIVLRVIDYRLEGIEGSEPIYRLATTILDPGKAPAGELAALYHERWEIETAFDELKTHLRGAHIVLRSKTPDLVRQEFYGLMMAHFAIRGLMHEAALKADEDPDRLSFLHAVRVIRRKLNVYGAIPPSAEENIS